MEATYEYFIQPHTLTVLCTYQCTAACRQCCFESSPSVIGKLSAETIKARISEAKREFDTLEMVVFSGGEAFLLKQDLYDSIAHASALNLRTRIVSNGSWGKSKANASKVASALQKSKLSEINISTGKDHQEWVPLESVVNAAVALVDADIFTLVTVELDNEQQSCLAAIMSDDRVRDMLRTRKLVVQSNSWMPFHQSAEDRKQSVDLADMRNGCDQIFGNMVVTPHDHLSACCGLTLEHIPEMRLGKNDGTNLGALYRSQADDFLKYWINVDGPRTIIERILGDRSESLLRDVVHVCQACVLLHKEPEVKAQLTARYHDFVPEVMTRFFLKMAYVRESRTYSPVPQHPKTEGLELDEKKKISPGQPHLDCIAIASRRRTTLRNSR